MGDGNVLSACRVLDLTDERGQLAGMILAQLGADVIAVEPPGGARSRQLEPAPALHLAYNRGKRSVVVDLTSDTGRSRFLDLVATSDILLESADPGAWDVLGLGREALEAVNPRLVTVSISAFGRSGPKAGWAASDLIAEAAACELMLTWGPRPATRAGQRPPGLPQRRRRRRLRRPHRPARARGQRPWPARRHLCPGGGGDDDAGPAARRRLRRPPHRPQRGGLKVGPLRINWIYPASDGWVTITVLFGPISAYTVRLIEWMVEEGAIEPEAATADWVHFLPNVLSGKVAAQELDHLQECIAAFTGSHTKAELLAGALERRVLMAPVATVPELLASDQLAAREYSEEVDGVRYPGPFAIAGGGGPRFAPLGASPSSASTPTRCWPPWRSEST